jgi:hypothetical protein
LPWPVHYETIDEPGFGGWADEKIEPAREAAPNVLIGDTAGNEIELTHNPAPPSQKKPHPQHLTISQMSVSETKVFRSKKRAKRQFDDWLQ